MENLTLVALVSIFSAALSIGIGSIGSSLGEASVAKEAMHSIALQPDEAENITKTLFMSMAMVESTAIYCLVISMILIFANPFWSFLLEKL